MIDHLKVILVFGIISGLFFFAKSRQDNAYRKLKIEGQVAEGEVIVARKGKRKHIEYKYFNVLKDSCVVGSRCTDYNWSNFPDVGERYKVYYGQNSEVLSVDEYLIKFKDSVLMINGDYYNIPDLDSIDSIDLDDYLTEICPGFQPR